MTFKSVTLLTTCVPGSVALLSVGTYKCAAGDMSASFAALLAGTVATSQTSTA